MGKYISILFTWSLSKHIEQRIFNQIKFTISIFSAPDEEGSGYPTWKKREPDVASWLKYLGLSKYEDSLKGFGYDDINFLGPDLISGEDELKVIGIEDESDRQAFMEALKKKGNSKGE